MVTLMYLRCVELRKYADQFIKYGTLKFGKPQEWIDAWYKEGNGRGDLLEGTFAAVHKNDKRNLDCFRQSRNNIIEKSFGDYIYFQRKDILNLRTCCLFGLNDDMFNKMYEAENKQWYPSGKITKDYFNDFINNIDKKSYDLLNDEEKPALIMIDNPTEFKRRIELYFINKGVKKEEILFQPVKYIDKNNIFLIDTQAPNELYIKDRNYSRQSEVRIVLNTENEDIIKELNDSNGIINLGPMDDIASIQGYYFDDFIMQRRGNSLLYILPEPIIESLDTWSEEKLIGLICQITHDHMPEPFKSEKEKIEMINGIEKILKDKYKIRIDWNKGCFQREYI